MNYNDYMGKTVKSKDGRFEWDSEKNALNIENHGFGFAEILEVFDDVYFMETYDALHSTKDEDRYAGLGEICGVGCVSGVVFWVGYTMRGNVYRLYSARVAEPVEEKRYYDYIKNFIR